MAVTSPDNIRTPDSGDQYALVQDLGVLADTTQAAISKRGNLYIGTAAQRTALVTAPNGTNWQDTDGLGMTWNRVSGSWVPGVWRWSGTTAQMTAFTVAPNGFSWFNTTDSSEYVRKSGAWYLWSRPWTTYTPTVTGFTLSGGVFSTARYRVQQGIVTVKIRAAVSSMTGNPGVSLPINASDSLVETLPGSVTLIPGAGSEAVGFTRKSSNNSVIFYAGFPVGSILYLNNISSTYPIPWGSTGAIASVFSYDVP